MADLKNQVKDIEANIGARDVASIASTTGNIYEVLAVISKRARQLNVDLKHELHKKLDEFAVTTDTIEELHENKEQVEISKFYERLPNPTLIATNEYLSEQLDFEYKERETEEEMPRLAE